MFDFLVERRVKLVYIPLVCYWIFLFILTTIPGSAMPDVKVSDKIEHFAAYFVLGALLCLAVMVQDKYVLVKKHPFVSSWFFIALYAGIDEMHQMFVPGRQADLLDWTADIVGAALALIVIAIIKKIDDGRNGPLRNGKVTIH